MYLPEVWEVEAVSGAAAVAVLPVVEVAEAVGPAKLQACRE